MIQECRKEVIIIIIIIIIITSGPELAKSAFIQSEFYIDKDARRQDMTRQQGNLEVLDSEQERLECWESTAQRGQAV